MKRLAIYQSAYCVEVRRMAAGQQYYAVVRDRESKMELWESRIYDDAEDAWESGRCEWLRRAEADEAHDLRESDAVR